MKINDIINVLENLASPALQETYDNAGLITGDAQRECTGVLCSLDTTEPVVEEAIKKQCNLIVAHHPVIFKGLKKITGKNYVERTIIKAIKNDISIYAIHTNLDNIMSGVNGKMADKLELVNRTVLLPRASTLKKLYTFVPTDHVDNLRNALFAAGAGHIGNYSSCSFNSEGTGTFKGEAGSNPFAGKTGELHFEKEVKIEVIFPAWLEQRLLQALHSAHPYEEVAYDVIALENAHQHIGAGLLGEIPNPMPEQDFLALLKARFGLRQVRHTRLTGNTIRKIALCGGSGSFLITNALQAKADIYISADIKYHEFFDANDQMVIADIGHFESEQYTVDILHDILLEKFPNFAVLKTAVNTNPVFYYA
ncbi:MAG: Nif3-like dinuclear metal center hexameric protein [Chitinophagaceae bacterium]|nr:Nif3-like dinuclear metal center hexameric protein [Chitinophagaceae bacterium]